MSQYNLTLEFVNDSHFCKIVCEPMLLPGHNNQ